MKNFMQTINLFLIAGVLQFFFYSAGYCQQVDLKGQLSATLVVNQDRSADEFIGLRYIPEMFVSTGSGFDFYAAVNGYKNYQGNSLANFSSEGKIKAYRLWLRFSGSQYEFRLGLQKINFGPAFLLRPLMWFDRIDPRDPLQLTDGVWGLLFRYYFLNNANVWLWALYGSDETKGWEIFPTSENKPEFGARIQLPFLRGEIGATAHFRQADFYPQEKRKFSESRFAFDGKWDVGIGLWVEAAMTHQNEESIPFKYQKMATFGADYTFALGNGLHILGEYFLTRVSRDFYDSDFKFDISALLVDYPIGLMDQIFTFFYYDWKNNDFYRLFRWQRTYDRWSWHLMAFWNPEQNLLPEEINSQMLFSGKGLMLIVVFNH